MHANLASGVVIALVVLNGATMFERRAYAQQVTYDEAIVKWNVDEEDSSAESESTVRFISGQAASGPVGPVAINDRRLELDFLPIAGQLGQYEIKARWVNTASPKQPPIFLMQSAIGKGETQTMSQIGRAGSIQVEIALLNKR